MDRGRCRQGSAPRNRPLWVPTRSDHAEGNSGYADTARRTRPWRGRRPLAGTATACAGPGSPCVWPCPSPHGPHGAPHGPDRDARTQGVGQCQSPSAATAQREPGARQHEQAPAATAAVVAGRARAKGTAGQHTRVRTQGRAALSRALDRGRHAARERPRRLPARWPPGDAMDRLREASKSLNHEAAPGMDGQPWATYGAQRAPTLRAWSDRRTRGASHAPPVERVSMPHAEGRQRPSGTPTLEDHIVQRATGAVRNALDAKAILGCSSGARPGRSPPQALDAVTVGREKRPSNGGLDADRRGLYDAIAHAWLAQCVEHRRGAQRVVRHRWPWRKAGVLEAGHGRQQEEGTPQGGSARRLLAPRSLHAVFALWAAQWRRLALGRWAQERRQRRGQGTPEPCDFLGLTPMGGTTTQGTCTVRRHTSAKRLRKKLQEVQHTLRVRMHWPIEKLGAWLKRVVAGHSRDDGVPRTMRRLRVFRERILR